MSIVEQDRSIPALTIKELDADPHRIFRRYRPLTPVIAHESGVYFLLRSDDVRQMVRDPRVRQTEIEFAKLNNIAEGALFDFFDFGMLTSNDDVHRRRRSPFTRTFAARLINEMRPHIRQTADSLVSDWYDLGEVDLVKDYGALIPARTISNILGLPQEDIPYFTKLIYSYSRILSFTFTQDDLPEIEADAQSIHDYVERLLASRRKAPQEDFLSGYLDTVSEAGELSPAEIVMQIVQLILGGTDTTRVASAVQVALLLQHPQQWEAVCRDTALIAGAVREALRYEPSVASVARIPLEDITLDGRLIPAGTFVILSTMSAMRDETAFSNPDVFDIRRVDQSRPHLIFGGGAHRCIGEALAFVELEEGLAALTQRIPQLRLVGDPPILLGHSGIRRLNHMRVAW
jgi:hypothetical protein